MNQQDFFDVLSGKVIMEFRMRLLNTVALPSPANAPLNECKWSGYATGKVTIISSCPIGDSGVVVVDGKVSFINSETSGVQLIGGYAITIIDDQGNEYLAAMKQNRVPLIAPQCAFEVLFSIYAQSYIGVL